MRKRSYGTGKENPGGAPATTNRGLPMAVTEVPSISSSCLRRTRGGGSKAALTDVPGRKPNRLGYDRAGFRQRERTVRRAFSAAICAWVLVVGASPAAFAEVRDVIRCADLSAKPIDFGAFDIDIVGEIDAATVEKVKKLFSEYHSHENDPECVIGGVRYVINSPGGSVAAAMELGRILRKERAFLLVRQARQGPQPPRQRLRGDRLKARERGAASAGR